MAQIGTVRLETQNSGAVDVPVFEPGDSASGIYEFVRVETASGPGFIPVTDPVDATYPYLRVQSQNNGIVAVTDTPGSDIPDSGVSRWTFDNADTSGSTAIDVFGNNDGSISGATTGVAGANETYNTSEAYSFDGTDDFVSLTENSFTDSDSWSVAFWAQQDTSTGGMPFGYSVDNKNFLRLNHPVQEFVLQVDSGKSWRFSPTWNTGSWNHWIIAVGGDSDPILYQNGSSVGAPFGNASSTSFVYDTIGNGHEGGFFFDGQLDDIRVYNKQLSSVESDNLYNNGSI